MLSTYATRRHVNNNWTNGPRTDDDNGTDAWTDRGRTTTGRTTRRADALTEDDDSDDGTRRDEQMTDDGDVTDGRTDGWTDDDGTDDGTGDGADRGRRR